MEYILDSDELQYLAAKHGVGQMEGVADDLITLGGSELQDRLLEIEKSLEKKDYISYDFNGDCTINNDLKRIIAMLVDADGQVMIENRINGEKDKELLYFVKGERAVRFEQKEQGYALNETDCSEINETLPDKIVTGEPEDDTAYIVKESLVQKVSGLAKHGNEKMGIDMLNEAGLPEDISRMTIDSLVERTDAYTAVFTKGIDDNQRVVSLAIFGNGDYYIINPAVDDDNEDAIEIKLIGSTEVKNIIRDGMRLVCMNKDGEEVA